MDDAITLRPVSELIFEFGMSKFQIANETLQDDGLRNLGIEDTSLAKSLGIFGLALILIIIVTGIYFFL